MVTGAAAVVVAGAALAVVVVGRVLDASSSRATDAVEVGVVLDCEPLLPQAVMSTAVARNAIPRIIFFTPACNQTNGAFGIGQVTDKAELFAGKRLQPGPTALYSPRQPHQRECFAFCRLRVMRASHGIRARELRRSRTLLCPCLLTFAPHDRIGGSVRRRYRHRPACDAHPVIVGRGGSLVRGPRGGRRQSGMARLRISNAPWSYSGNCISLAGRRVGCRLIR